MAAQWTEIVVDCTDPQLLAEFWCQVLGWQVIDSDEDSVEIYPAPISDADWVGNIRSGPVIPSILFLRVPEQKSVKNRLHIDVSPVDCTQPEEVTRILELGATLLEPARQEGRSWSVLADPEGNEFCVLRSLAPPIDSPILTP